MITPEQTNAAVDTLFAEIDAKVAAGNAPEHGYKMGIRLFSAVRDRLQETSAEALEDQPVMVPLVYHGVSLRYSNAWVAELEWAAR